MADSAQPRLTPPILEHSADGFGLAHARPRVSWRFEQPAGAAEPANQGWTQYAYELQIRRGEEEEEEETHTYRVTSAQSVLVPWPAEAAALGSRAAAAVRVRAFGRPQGRPQADEERDATAWSAWTRAEATLLAGRADWTAQMVGWGGAAPLEPPNSPLRPVRFRKAFATAAGHGPAVRARLYVTSLGVYRAFVNGQRVGGEARPVMLAPGWTSYHHRLVFQTYDVTALLRARGQPATANVLAAEVAEGWYAGRLSVRGGRRHIWGDAVALLAQLELQYADGAAETVATDGSWRCRASATLTAEIYDGEVYDMGAEEEGWAGSPDGEGEPERSEDGWSPAKALPFTQAQLVPQDAPPIRVVEERAVQRVLTSPAGKRLLDFGQNLVGVVRVQGLALAAGARLTLYHGEVLDRDGELARAPLREAQCRDVVVGSGAPLAAWQPSYTFHGFRYVQVDLDGEGGLDSLDDPLRAATLTALVVHSDMPRRGWFECSDPLVNRLHENTVWGVRGNMLGVPTDCPQRDERLGWTGDLQIIAPSMAFVYDCVSTVAAWLQDVAAEQLAKGNGIPGSAVPDVLPAAWQSTPQAVWHDVVVLTPWDLYAAAGDPRLLAAQLPSMRAWLDQGVRRGPDGLWDPDLWQLGDWLDPAAPGDDPGRGLTEGVYVADAYLVRVTATLAQVCAVLAASPQHTTTAGPAGLAAAAAAYEADAARLRAAFQRKYVTPGGRVANHTQTALALALQFDLLPADARRPVGDALARLVRRDRFRVTTGLVGTALIAPALSAAGHTPLAYRMLAERECPSFLYPVTMGATTVWERWDSLRPDGSVNPDPMTSFNHYALGSVARWLHATVAGLRSADGWKTVLVRPEPGGTLAHAEARLDGPYGRLRARWHLLPDGADATNATHFALHLTVPPNSVAHVCLPGVGVPERAPRVVGSGEHAFRCRYDPAASGEPWPPRPFLPFFRPEGFTWARRLDT